MSQLLNLLLITHALGYQGILIADTKNNLDYLQSLGLTQWYTKPNGSTLILLPYGFEDTFEYSYTYGTMADHTDFLYFDCLKEELQNFTTVMQQYKTTA